MPGKKDRSSYFYLFSLSRVQQCGHLQWSLRICTACLRSKEPSPTSSLLWTCLYRAIEVNLHSWKVKMANLVRGVTIYVEGLGQFQWMVGNVFEMVWAKAHEWIELAKSNCSRYPVLQQNCDFVNEEGSRVVWSCFRLSFVYGKCLQSLLELLFVGSESLISFAKFLLR